MIGMDTVKIMRVNKAKVWYFFTERVADVKPLFEKGEIEMRITLGKNWNNYLAINKLP